jgi:hypothetical protein
MPQMLRGIWIRIRYSYEIFFLVWIRIDIKYAEFLPSVTPFLIDGI